MERLGDLENIQFLLEECGAYMSASEVHGLATGMLCVNHGAELSAWLASIFEPEQQTREPNKEELQDLATLFVGALELLKSENFIFNLFLPSDGETVLVRATALSEWCQGFLYGIAYAGAGDDASWGEEGRGVLKDLTEISRLDPGSSEDADEQHFMELHEYVRVAVQIVMDELQPSEPSKENEEPTLH
ncbi:MAG: hypothetical protein A6F71_05280 [Cycloclasticus sp. symbiont of Poecilosclerida sp. M]|nr:MAG: hypothetical protein A6F71_05280 [Cycloclasticus sp. symbiont of Poecilosclerida sp. M]